MGTYISINPERTGELLAQGHKVYHPIPIKLFLKTVIIPAGLAPSMSEAKRLLKAGAIKIDSKRLGPDEKFVLLEMN